MTAAALRLVDTPAKGTRRPSRKIADLMCGAGGTSQGTVEACEELGFEADLLAVNHWPLAIETHTLNHPKARHVCQDIETVRPIQVVPGGRLHLLCASPTCTVYSRARGGRPVNDQQRQQPWQLLTWLTELKVDALLVENVPELMKWGPVDPRTGKPIKSRNGEFFHAWVRAIEALGFKVDWRIINCADFGDATTRQRFFLIARSDGKPIRWPEPTHARSVDGLPGLGPSKKWRAARQIIDWRQKGRSIFDRKKPLSEKTLRRILAGAVKFRWPRVFRLLLEEHLRSPALKLMDLLALPPVTEAAREHREEATPLVFRLNQSGERARETRTIEQPVQTITATGTDLGLAQPIAVILRNNADAKSLEEPVSTITAGGIHTGLAEPIVVRTDMHRSNSAGVFSPEDPLRTITTSGGLGVAEPVIVSTRQNTGGPAPRSSQDPLPTLTATDSRIGVAEPFILGQQIGSAPRSVKDPLPTVATDGAIALAEPFLLSPGSGGAPRSVDEPAPAIVAGTNGLAHAVLTPYFGSSKVAESVEDPLRTVTTKDRRALVVPITHTKSGDGLAQDVEQPLRTIVPGNGGELALVAPVTHEGADRTRDVSEPLPTITGAHRGELACIVAQFGERPGQTPRVHSLEDPMPTLCAGGRVNLAEATESGDAAPPPAPAREFDILFRMLRPHELAAATGFIDPADFDRPERQYRFAGNSGDVIKQIGNAVPVNTARALTKAILEGGRRE